MDVEITKTFRFVPPERGGRVEVVYAPGTYTGVRRIAAEQAAAEGKGRIVRDPMAACEPDLSESGSASSGA